ncbi:MAG: hypothetical protein IJB74_03910 [Clostridia bacterium]|nr:hypothetical protein [Clostridia bacterium]
MQSATALIDSFIKAIGDSEILNNSCQAIRAYENKSLPVPIKKTYFSFSAEENKLYFSDDGNGNKSEINSVKISVSCFIPLTLSPALIYTLTETVMTVLMNSNENIIGISLGKAEYDSDVDAFRIKGILHFQTEKII